MSDATAKTIGSTATEAGIRAAWAQWAALGANASGGQELRAPSIIDPEALLLASLWLTRAERRLQDFVYWWAGVGAELLSVQRTKTLLRRFPPSVEERLGAFAQWATEAGDKRWKRYLAEGESSSDGREGKGVEKPRLRTPPALMLRLRAGFGVGAKADVLTFLLGIAEDAVSTPQAAQAVCYSRATAMNVLEDLTRAGFVQKEPERGTVRHFARYGPWAELLRPGGPPQEYETNPRWHYWADVFPFLCWVGHWQEETSTESSYLQSSRARDLFEKHERAFTRNRLRVPSPGEYRGADYLDAFRETVDRLADWTEKRY